MSVLKYSVTRVYSINDRLGVTIDHPRYCQFTIQFTNDVFFCNSVPPFTLRFEKEKDGAEGDKCDKNRTHHCLADQLIAFDISERCYFAHIFNCLQAKCMYQSCNALVHPSHSRAHQEYTSIHHGPIDASIVFENDKEKAHDGIHDDHHSFIFDRPAYHCNASMIIGLRSMPLLWCIMVLQVTICAAPASCNSRKELSAKIA